MCASAWSIAEVEVGEILGGGSEVRQGYVRRLPLCVRALGVRCARSIRRLRHLAAKLRGAVPQRLLLVRVELV